MAQRPIFVPLPDRFPYVQEVAIDFQWFPGFARSQAQKSIASLHGEAARIGFSPLLEISSKSPDPVGIALSAFNLMFKVANFTLSVESAFQGSKVLEKGGPFHDLYELPGYQAKKDPRLTTSGKVTAFKLNDLGFPTKPLTAFYDWLYLSALVQNPTLTETLLNYAGFTDIAFNPDRSINCQARSAALFVALTQLGKLPSMLEDVESYLRVFVLRLQ